MLTTRTQPVHPICRRIKNRFVSIRVQHGEVQLPPKSPNLNAHLERFMRSIKSECLEKMIFFRENMLRNAVREYLSHYHHERNHQGLDNTIIDPKDEVGKISGKIECRERLGGILRYYYRDAA